MQFGVFLAPHGFSDTKSPTQLYDEALEQAHLILREEFGFQVIEDDSAILEQLLRGLGKTVAKLELIDRVQAREHWLIVALDIFLRLIAKAAEERVDGNSGALLHADGGDVPAGFAGLF